MTRPSHRSLLLRIGVIFVCAFAVAMAPAASFAQHGGGHGGGGGHNGGRFGGASHMGSAHATHASPHIPYQPGGARGSRQFAPHSYFVRPFASNASNSHIVIGRPFPRNPSFRSRFGFYPYGFLPWDYGFAPWWGWDSDWNDCDPYYENCGYQQPSPEQPGPQSNYVEPGYVEYGDYDQRPMIVVYLRDGTGYGALDYWVNNGTLHIETTYGAKKSFPMEEVDLERTGKENAERGVSFTFHTTPMISDPGSVLAPDSYAPACPSGASASSTRPVPSGAAANATSSFGVSGSATEKGLAVGSVRANSPAAQAGIHVGDVVVRIGCQPIHTAQDMESAFGGSSSEVWVTYLIQGSWATDKKVVR